METDLAAVRRLYSEATAGIDTGRKEEMGVGVGETVIPMEKIDSILHSYDTVEGVINRWQQSDKLLADMRAGKMGQQRYLDHTMAKSYSCSEEKGMSADYQEKYLDARFASIDEKIGRIGVEINEFRQDVKLLIESERTRTDALNARIDASHARVDNLKIWIVGTALALLGAVIGVMQIQNSWVIDSVNRIESSVSQIKGNSMPPSSSTPIQNK